MSEILLAIVDDEALIVSLLSDYFNEQKEITVCCTANSGEEFITSITKLKKLPEVLILDLKMKELSGIDVLHFLKKNYPTVRTVIMSSFYKKSFMGFMLKTGASAFIPKGISPKELLIIIKEIKLKGFFFMPDQIDVIKGQISAKAPKPSIIKENDLSEREIDILKLICFQKTAKEIGEQLFITQRTVEGHKNSLYIKTETKNIAGLVIYAIQNNIINADEVVLF